MFLKYYQGLDVPGATPGDRTETCMSEDRSQTAGTEPGGGEGGASTLTWGTARSAP